MKINVSCGKQTWEGFYCIDAVQHPRASRPLDMLYQFRFGPDGRLLERISLDDGCAEEIHCHHFIEHVHEWEAAAVMGELRRLLARGGRLCMELPNIEHACRNLLAGERDQMSMWPLYGDGTHKDPFMCHKYGYTPKTIKALAKAAGFRDVQVLPPKYHGRRANRDMRLEAVG